MPQLTLQFLGAAGTVTGSRHLLSIGDREVLIDCGLFQGRKPLRLQNWQPFPIPPSQLDAVLLTHAHLDHTGWLPRLVKEGFHDPIYCSRPTADLVAIVLPDSGHLQEEDANFANRRGFSKHQPALPLYTAADAQEVLPHLHPVENKQSVQLPNGFQFHFHNAGHIVGSKSICVSGEGVRVWFSGDLGRRIPAGQPPLDAVDYAVVECTYGNRVHPTADYRPRLAQIIQETVRRQGSVIIPAFAIERTQKMLFILRSLMDDRLIPRVPIHVDSPMAIEAVKVFMKYTNEFRDDETRQLVQRHGNPVDWPGVFFDKTPEQSKHAGASREPLIILSASGMVEGGRVLHHLAQRLPDHRNTVIFVGFQAPGTRGQALLSGVQAVRIHGQEIPVRARIEFFEEFSDHADSGELLHWLEALPAAPKQVFLVHGEPDGARAFAESIEKKFGWKVHIAVHNEKIVLS